MERKLLAEHEIAGLLPGVTGWQSTGQSLVRRLTFPGFPEAMAFALKLVDPAEAINHHPDIRIVYNTIDLTLNTHDQGGLTALDFELAKRINELIR